MKTQRLPARPTTAAEYIKKHTLDDPIATWIDELSTFALSLNARVEFHEHQHKDAVDLVFYYDRNFAWLTPIKPGALWVCTAVPEGRGQELPRAFKSKPDEATHQRMLLQGHGTLDDARAGIEVAFRCCDGGVALISREQRAAEAQAGAVDASQEESAQSVDVETERLVEAWLRTEQEKLRKIHFSRAKECEICGRILPTDLMWAAHIKPRARCTREERLDLPNIAMRLCKLGCDEFYEKGYVGVGEDGRVMIAKSAPSTGELGRVLSALRGRTCTAMRADTSAYFTWHRTHVFASRNRG